MCSFSDFDPWRLPCMALVRCHSRLRSSLAWLLLHCATSAGASRSVVVVEPWRTLHVASLSSPCSSIYGVKAAGWLTVLLSHHCPTLHAPRREAVKAARGAARLLLPDLPLPKLLSQL